MHPGADPWPRRHLKEEKPCSKPLSLSLCTTFLSAKSTVTMKSVVAVVLALMVVAGLCTAQKPHSRKAELLESNDEMLARIQGQLLNALEMLQVYQEGPETPQVVGIPANQLKFTEKRRNKFEFIRFGRR
ncbi:unnamed protein product [Bursaphelenchus okinawaensis]|uniref:Uncharacterized protein n=1 Tax=Bursaphelenchus okinawaensis TaxID=465554 RepID=A0A811KHN2_9BILA|nr:unnamed protein product [Bursaphelenchus okinawaensis]CAG9103299.1 unnamed protein product [Bursaphelenchus okinawaensis]